MTTPAKKAPLPVPAASPSTPHGLPPRGPNSSSNNKLAALGAEVGGMDGLGEVWEVGGEDL